jgi:hypothetical protein
MVHGSATVSSSPRRTPPSPPPHSPPHAIGAAIIGSTPRRLHPSHALFHPLRDGRLPLRPRDATLLSGPHPLVPFFTPRATAQIPAPSHPPPDWQMWILALADRVALAGVEIGFHGLCEINNVDALQAKMEVMLLLPSCGSPSSPSSHPPPPPAVRHPLPPCTTSLYLVSSSRILALRSSGFVNSIVFGTRSIISNAASSAPRPSCDPTHPRHRWTRSQCRHRRRTHDHLAPASCPRAAGVHEPPVVRARKI